MYNDDVTSTDFAGVKIKNGYIVFTIYINKRFNKLV